MSLNKRKKAVKFRGHHTHGYGSKKKHRGSGHQGGVGMAGTGKKADQKKTKIWKDKKYFGRHGFRSKNVPKIKAINIFYIENHIEQLVASGVAKKEGSKYVLDLASIKCNKLLGSGTPTKVYEIKTDYATSSAVEKIQTAKGAVTVKFSSNQSE
jgi:large subunit ribosomal protein L15